MPLSPAIQIYVDQKILTQQEAQNLNYFECETLKELYDFIANKQLTVRQVLNLTGLQHQCLSANNIRALIANRTITIKQALNLNLNQQNNLRIYGINALIANGALTLKQALNLQEDQRSHLSTGFIYDLITDKTITIREALALTDEMYQALRDANTRQRLRDGDLPMRDFLAAHMNKVTSTHTASVHKTTSKSAARLLKRYKKVKLNEQIEKMTQAIHALPANHFKNEVAKRCIDRLTKLDYTHKDRASGVNIRQLLALSWLAIHDDTMRTGTVEDAVHLFIDGLYEIQRGYNLSDTGVDQGGPDKPICAAGAFNKLLEKLIGVHPDVVIVHITPEIASLKLPNVVKEEAKNYLINKKNFSTLKEYEALIKRVEEEGVSAIWDGDGIKKNVTQCMWEMFHGLYTKKNDPSFTELIDSAEYVELRTLFFQKELSQLPIYAEQTQGRAIQYNQIPNQVVQYRELAQVETNSRRVNRDNSPENRSKTPSCWSSIFKHR